MLDSEGEERPEPLPCYVTLSMSQTTFSFTSLYRNKEQERASRKRQGTDMKPRPREGQCLPRVTSEGGQSLLNSRPPVSQEAEGSEGKSSCVSSPAALPCVLG